MRLILLWGLSMVIVLLLSAIGHERDIYNACEKHGHSLSAMWTKEIKCSPLDPSNE